MMMAAEGGHKDTVELMLDRGADLEAKDGVSRAMLRSGRTSRGRHGRSVDRDERAIVMACWVLLGGSREVASAELCESREC